MIDSCPIGTVRIGPAACIPSVLDSLGVRPEEVLSELGFELSLFDDPENFISFRARARLLQLCATRTNCEHFGLLVGQRGGLSSFGLIGYLVQHSLSVGSALRSLENHFHLHAKGSMATFETNDELAFLGYSIYEENIDAVPQLIDAAVALSFNIMRNLCGAEWNPVEVCFARSMPRDIKPYRQFFGAPLQFDSEHSGVFFPRDCLDQSIAGADPDLYRLLEMQVTELELRYKDDFPAQVKRMLNSVLLTQHLVTADQIASLFSIHSRTLHRRLKAHGTNFQAIADQCRSNIAQQMLTSTDKELSQVAEMLGYADVRAFNRAFKRWTGATPAKWRSSKNHKDTL